MNIIQAKYGVLWTLSFIDITIFCHKNNFKEVKYQSQNNFKQKINDIKSRRVGEKFIPNQNNKLSGK